MLYIFACLIDQNPFEFCSNRNTISYNFTFRKYWFCPIARVVKKYWPKRRDGIKINMLQWFIDAIPGDDDDRLLMLLQNNYNADEIELITASRIFFVKFK